MGQPLFTLHMNGPEDRERVTVAAEAFSFAGDSGLVLAPFDAVNSERGKWVLAWHHNDWYRTPAKSGEQPFGDTTTVDRAMISSEHSKDVHVFIGRRRVGRGVNVRIELSDPKRPVIRAGTRHVAAFVDGGGADVVWASWEPDQYEPQAASQRPEGEISGSSR